MRIDYFKYLFNNEVTGFNLTKDVMFFRKPVELWNEKTDISVKFKTVDEALEYELDGKKVKDIILELDDIYIPAINGGRGASSGSNGTFKFGHASDGNGDNGTPLLPAYANTKIKSKTFEGALAEFKRNHMLSDREFAYEIDSQGYVHQYVRGDRSSVAIGTGRHTRKRDTMIVHNHPSGGAFSDADLLSTAMDRRSKGIIASGKKHDYIFEKGTHFKTNEFSKAVKRAKMKGKDYDDAVDKWLKRNQKKYGYKYSRSKN